MAAATSTASKDRQERNDNNNKQIANEIKNVVKKELGLSNGVATNLTGKDKFMYGKEASTATKKAMANAGLGTYNKEKDSFVNVVGNKIIGNANTIMYGKSNSAMGSGDPSGVMTSIPLSKKMLESQNKTKGLIVGALSLGMPGVGGTLMRADAGKALLDVKQSDAAYEDYTKGFKAKQEGKKFTSQRNVQGIIQLGLTKGKKSLKEKLGL